MTIVRLTSQEVIAAVCGSRLTNTGHYCSGYPTALDGLDILAVSAGAAIVRRAVDKYTRLGDFHFITEHQMRGGFSRPMAGKLTPHGLADQTTDELDWGLNPCLVLERFHNGLNSIFGRIRYDEIAACVSRLSCDVDIDILFAKPRRTSEVVG